MKNGYLSPKSERDDYKLLSYCDTIYKDALNSTPEFRRMMKQAKAGDEIVVINLWDIGNTLQGMVTTIDRVRKKGITLTILNCPWVNEGVVMDDLILTLNKIKEIKSRKRKV